MKHVFACAVAVALAGGVASAQPPDEMQKAAALYDKGKRHFDIAEYTAAIAAWKEAYLLSSEPLLLFNIAQAHRLAGDCAQANRFYLNYKRVQPRPPNQAELDSAMAKCAGVAPATGDTTPLEPSLPVAGEPTPPAPGPVPSQAPPPSAATVEIDEGRTLRYSGVAVAGAGAVAGIIAIVYAVRASEKADDVADRAIGTTWTTDLQQIQSDGQSAQTRARLFGVVSAIGLLGGAAVWYYGRTKSNVKVDVAVAPRETSVSLSCVF